MDVIFVDNVFPIYLLVLFKYVELYSIVHPHLLDFVKTRTGTEQTTKTALTAGPAFGPDAEPEHNILSGQKSRYLDLFVKGPHKFVMRVRARTASLFRNSSKESMGSFRFGAAGGSPV